MKGTTIDHETEFVKAKEKFAPLFADHVTRERAMDFVCEEYATLSVRLKRLAETAIAQHKMMAR